MSERNEDAAMAKVLDRIAERFPTVSRGRIEAIVGEERARLSGSRIRDYIAVLVERTTTDRLRNETVVVSAPGDAGVGTLLHRDPDRSDPMERDARSQSGGALRSDLGGPSRVA
ncbi:three-helix bundle dimerization domain-containing protein [Microbacterium sp. ASV81]|uniref:Uncharacterized protein n=1 Tax=Microbacterium capsulatum TaxID=3041921 RepID=A0ABU0XD91_9MICO|nr:hypothetical protein [Microbacterium sp. ASV81]MDQ4213077.1 hypothetical protein [Microbacterium sp. ASV81]